MATVRIVVSPDMPPLSDEQIKELDRAKEMPVTFDDDCPEMTEETLKKFKRASEIARSDQKRHMA